VSTAIPRGEPRLHCPHCSYDLAGVESIGGVILCPECGRDREPGLLNTFERLSAKLQLVRMCVPFASCLAFAVVFQLIARAVGAPDSTLTCFLMTTLIFFLVVGPAFAILGPSLKPEGKLRRWHDWAWCYAVAVLISVGLGAASLAMLWWRR
jgi:hypothetical protein